MSILSTITTITSVASALESVIEDLTNSSAIATSWTKLKSIYTSVANFMQSAEAAWTTGTDKKAKVLSVVKVLCAALGIDYTSIASLVSTWIDTIKTAYNSFTAAASAVIAEVKKDAAVIGGAASGLPAGTTAA